MIINYLITSVNAKREKMISPETQMSISTKISIENVEKVENAKLLKFDFKFDAVFNGNGSDELGRILIQGFVVYTGENLEEIYENWQDPKKRDESVNIEVLQAGLNISTLEAISLSKMLQLPSVIPLPKVSPSNAQEEPKHEKKKK